MRAVCFDDHSVLRLFWRLVERRNQQNGSGCAGTSRKAVELFVCPPLAGTASVATVLTTSSPTERIRHGAEHESLIAKKRPAQSRPF